MSFATPVAFFIYNRPRETRRTFERIAQIRPRTLLVVADGPRSQAERQACADTRIVLRDIDWDCDVRANFSDKNMGCGKRVASGLDWVFNEVEEVIILEDDCLPDPTFFPFSAELLERYRDEPGISMISGDNFQFGERRSADSYYFSIIPHIWGWATWRRAWRHFDLAMQRWPALRETDWLSKLLGNGAAAGFYRNLFNRGHRGEIDTWDIQWTFASFLQNGLAVLPQTNLITNIGFGDAATHTRSRGAREANLPVMPMSFPLQHPIQITRHVAADEFTFESMFGVKSLAA